MKYNDNLIINHEFESPSSHFGAANPPIVQSSLYVFETYEKFIEASKSEEDNFIYSRGNNPTLKVLEMKLAALEQTEKAKVFASGMGAISSSLIALLKSGDHVLVINHVYGSGPSLLGFLSRYGVSFTQVFSSDLETIEKEIKDNTKVIFFESPSSTMMKILDIKAICSLAKKKNCYTIFDNSVNTPLVTKASTLGVDIVINSLSKYLSGHSDVVAGVACTTRELHSRIFKFGHQLFGSVLGAQEAYLVLRGMRTLSARLAYQQQSFKIVLEFLKNNKNVKNINHPLVYEGETKAICEKQMNGYTTLFSFELATDSFEKIKTFVNELKNFQIAASWGGHESLVRPVYRGYNEKELKEDRFPLSLIRMYIGLEDPNSLITDIEYAMKKMEQII
jgi:cystathionine beta-lyase/cystathionine gamma-synthase